MRCFVQAVIITGLLALSARAEPEFRVCGWQEAGPVGAARPDDRPLRTMADAPGAAHLVRREGPEGADQPPAHCGAVAIGPHWVLTARHCVDDRRWRDMRIDLGSPAIGSDAAGLERGGTVALCPAATEPGSLDGDLALVRLDDDVPPEAVSDAWLDDPDPASLGIPADAWLVSWPTAAMPIGTPVARRLSLRLVGVTPAGHILADLADSGQRPPCGGESGSPVYVVRGGETFLAGVLSAIVTPNWATASGRRKCLLPQTRVLFSPVAPWHGWIIDTMAECDAHPEACVRPE